MKIVRRELRIAIRSSSTQRPRTIVRGAALGYPLSIIRGDNWMLYARSRFVNGYMMSAFANVMNTSRKSK